LSIVILIKDIQTARSLRNSVLLIRVPAYAVCSVHGGYEYRSVECRCSLRID